MSHLLLIAWRARGLQAHMSRSPLLQGMMQLTLSLTLEAAHLRLRCSKV